MPRTIPNNDHLRFGETNTWIALFEVQVAVGTTYYFTPNSFPVVVDSNTYTSFPMVLEELTESSDGSIPSCKLVCSNISGQLSSAIKANGSLDGYSITFKIASLLRAWKASTTYSVGDKIFQRVEWLAGTIRYREGHIFECTTGGLSWGTEPVWDRTGSSTTSDNTIVWKEDSTATDNIVFEEVQEIIKTGPITKKSITLEIGVFNPYLVKLLQRKYLTDFCWNTYKGKGCYISKPDGTFLAPSGFTDHGSCDKSLSDCINNTNTSRFNAFPTLNSKGSRFV